MTLAPFGLLGFVAFLLPWPTADLMRYAGLILQLLGIFTVAKNLVEKVDLFNRPGIREMARAAFASFPKWGRRTTVNTAIAQSSLAKLSSHAEASVWRGYKDKTLEERIDAIIANLEELKAQHVRAIDQIKSEHRALREVVDKKLEDHARSVSELQRKLTALGVSGIHIDAAGVVWLVFGVVLSTIPSELAYVLHML